ncbi:MAG TPA: response regulator [Bryobacteraceae bacterium]|nr:response regulator [Bryobacteraceae bacterium]
MGDIASSTATILLLDSDPVTRASLRGALQDANYLVVAAGDLNEAIDRLAEIKVDLLMTRPYVNSMPGAMAADYLRGRRPGLPVLIVAGFMDNDQVDVRSAVHDFHTFPKPFHRAELLAKVRAVLVPAQNRASI